MRWKTWILALTCVVSTSAGAGVTVERFRVPEGAHPHDTARGKAEVIEPPTPNQGARRVWSDSAGRIWVSEWQSGQLSRYDPKTKAWRAWRVPGEGPKPYAVYVDERDHVWISDFGANAMHRFDPASERFESFPSPESNAAIRQILGRKGEVWAPESGTDHLTVYRTE